MTPEDTIKPKVIIFFLYQARAVLQKGKFMHTHKMTKWDNFQSKIASGADFRQQFTLQFYVCSVMWNVNRFQRGTPGLSLAPSGMCPVCSGRSLYLVMLTALKKQLCPLFFNCPPCTRAQIQTRPHSLLLSVQMKKARHHYISTTELKSDMAK